jgi:ribonuclease E
MATCPECEFDEIDTTEHEEGDELSCPECGKTLVMSGLDELEVADDDLDDDDDDDDDEEEEAEEDLEEGLLEDEDEVDDEEDE